MLIGPYIPKLIKYQPETPEKSAQTIGNLSSPMTNLRHRAKITLRKCLTYLESCLGIQTLQRMGQLYATIYESLRVQTFWIPRIE